MRTSPRLLLDSLKRCPLCEAVNAESNRACFVCGWEGNFDRDAEEVQASFDALIAQCPDLQDMVTKPAKRSWWSQVKKRLGK